MITITITETEEYKKAKAKVKANPKKKGATPMDYKKEIGQPIIFDIILDISGSMKDFYDELVFCIMNILIPALEKAGERYRGPVRIGCLLFSGKLVPAWYGYKTLEEIRKNPLTRKMLDQDGLQGRTALYGAMKAGVLWTAATMDYMRETGRGEMPKGKLIVLTDGANNEDPLEESAVMRTVDGVGKANANAFFDKGMNNKVIGFFNTNDGLSETEFKEVCKNTGFEGLGFYEIAKGKSLAEKQASFRHYFKIFSSQASR